MPRSRFSTLIKKYSIQSEPLAFPIGFGPKQLNTTVKKLLKENDVDTCDINFNFFINGHRLSEPLSKFIETMNISEEIEEICYGVEMQPPKLNGETKSEDVVTRLSIRSKWLAAASYEIQIFDITDMEKPRISIEMEFDMFTVEWLSLDEVEETGIIIVGGAHGNISLWRCDMKAATAVKICKFVGAKQNIQCLSVNSQRNLVACGTVSGMLFVWSSDLSDLGTQTAKDVPTRLPLCEEVAHKLTITEIQWLSTAIEPVSAAKHPSAASINTGNLLTGSWDHTLKLWNFSADNICSIVREVEADVKINCFNSSDSNGGLVACGMNNKRLRIYDLKEKTAEKHTILTHRNNFMVAVKWSHVNPNLLITAGIDGDLKMWDLRSMAAPLMDISKYDASIIYFAWSDSGEYLAAAHTDGALRVYKFNK